MSSSRYWLLIASRDHVQRGLEGGFCQANHGKAQNLKRMQKGDGVVFYSPKEKYGESTPLQQFTAIGRIIDDGVYQEKIAPDFEPFRRKVDFAKSHETPIAPLIDALTFIKNKEKWGMTFRFGFLEIPEADFTQIEKQMLKNPA